MVIGGGITGAGIAREMSQRGLSVALLEAEDFASGTSSRSSKLIHGGLRYLAMGDLALVRETALERKHIVASAPHLAERRWMLVPSRSRAGMLKIRVGVSTYERLGAVDEEDAHSNWGARDLQAHEPIVNHKHTPWACIYREYLTDDARLVMANLRAAVRDGAVVLNHAPVDSIPREGERAAGVEASCTLTGRRFRVRAGAVVNAAGPWVEAVRKLEDRAAKPLLVLSKGIHIVLPRERLPLHNMIVMGTHDSRSIFAIPRGGIVYIGTTDTLHPDGAEVWPSITTEDVEYLLEPLPRYLTVEPVKAEEVLGDVRGDVLGAREAVEAKEGALERARTDLEQARVALREAEAQLTRAESAVDLQATDALLFRGIQRKLLTEDRLEQVAIRVEVNKGVVTLRGSVPDLETRGAAIEIAREFPGVASVNDGISVQEPDVAAQGDDEE